MPKPPKKPLTAKQKERKQNITNYKSYVTRTLKKDPEKSAADLIKGWRDKGKAIGNDMGKDIVRVKKGLEKNPVKQAATSQRIRLYGVDKNPRNVTAIIKDRFQYTVKFEVIKEGFVSSDEEMIIVPSPRKLSKMEIEDAVLAYVEDMKGREHEKYQTMGIVDGSIQVLYGIDKQKGTPPEKKVKKPYKKRKSK